MSKEIRESTWVFAQNVIIIFFEIVIFFSPEKIGHPLSLNVGLWDTI